MFNKKKHNILELSSKLNLEERELVKTNEEKYKIQQEMMDVNEKLKISMVK